ncbi:hypothetical protein [Planococcus beigongshangi]|uniref:AbiTii domain-containing protein n=1 Tax=Planococcus beigongshangi TaxID=2782536 RepID=UPI00193B302C|nr:hypothetical protein [Planococcus beigongshangi]
MARSQLLKDIVSGKEQLENILMRLKVILSDLDNEIIMNWVDGELRGYKDPKDIPPYRKLRGIPYGTFLVNFQTTYTEAQVPLEVLLDKETITNLCVLEFKDGIKAIENMLNGDNRNNIAKPISTAFCHKISVDELQIASMKVKFSSNQVDGLVSNVKSKLIEVIMELEKQFDNIEDLDIKEQIDDDSTKKSSVIYNIENIIYEGSIDMGDKNKIKGSRIGNLLSRGDKN